MDVPRLLKYCVNALKPRVLKRKEAVMMFGCLFSTACECCGNISISNGWSATGSDFLSRWSKWEVFGCNKSRTNGKRVLLYAPSLPSVSFTIPSVPLPFHSYTIRVLYGPVFLLLHLFRPRCCYSYTLRSSQPSRDPIFHAIKSTLLLHTPSHTPIHPRVGELLELGSK